MSKHLSVNQTQLLKQHKYIFKKLASVSDADRKRILKTAPLPFFRALGLVFKLISDGRLQLTNRQRASFGKYNRFLRSTDGLKTSAIRKKIQGQSGGFFGGLLKLVVPAITSLFK